MKKTKIFISIFMALAILTASMVPAFAAEEYNIDEQMNELQIYCSHCEAKYGINSEPGALYLKYVDTSLNNLKSVINDTNDFINSYYFGTEVTEESINEKFESLKNAESVMYVTGSELEFLINYCGKETNLNNYYDDDIWEEFKNCIDNGTKVLNDSSEDSVVDKAYWDLMASYNKLCTSNQVMGDVDNNGVATIKDAAVLQLYLANYLSLNSSQRLVGAVINSCVDIKITDVSVLQLHLAKLYDGELNCYELVNLTDNVEAKEWDINPLFKQAMYERYFGH